MISEKSRSMNGVAVRVYELILWGIEATPQIYYFKLLKCLKTIRVYLCECCQSDFFRYLLGRKSHIWGVGNTLLGSRWDNKLFKRRALGWFPLLAAARPQRRPASRPSASRARLPLGKPRRAYCITGAIGHLTTQITINAYKCVKKCLKRI